ncbi:hypothetical protein [Kutzneria chonburiensis]|uniref:Secreted protein n=1 Tax=Kutzneria chonburiensis TaxID=1483604 RepID=A0ABV6MJN1_9PSEU|nr:hypothetical protein [Kutzneria chonburiensis]
MIRRLLPALLAVPFLLGLTALPASASTAATSCYGGAISLTYHYSTAAVEYGTYTTSSRCKDINMRLTTDNGTFLDACVVFVDHTTLCNNDNAYQTMGPPWLTVATDVKDGTHFKLRVHAYDIDSQLVHFQLAF